MAVGPGRKKRADSKYAAQAADLAAQLHGRRLQAGLTQQQLAARADVSLSTLRNIESGRVFEPSLFSMPSLLLARHERPKTVRTLAHSSVRPAAGLDVSPAVDFSFH